jgi:ribose 1,5-bisphosphokinase
MLIYVMGPSGAGKDSLIAHLRHIVAGPYAATWNASPRSKCKLRPVHFIRRYITRPASAGGENHRPLTVREYRVMKQSGHFAMNWESHGLCYGIGRELDMFLADGDVAVVNGSREYLPEARKRYPDLTPLLITARPEVLRARLEGRGREGTEDIEERLRGAELHVSNMPGLITVDNSGDITEAQRHLAGILHCLRLPEVMRTGFPNIPPSAVGSPFQVYNTLPGDCSYLNRAM